MRQSIKRWVAVHFRPDPSQDFKGFAIFSVENWERYCLGLPDKSFIVWLNHYCLRAFESKEDYLRHLQVIFLSDEEFRCICYGVLGYSMDVLIEFDKLLNDTGCEEEEIEKGKDNIDRASLVKYGMFPEYVKP